IQFDPGKNPGGSKTPPVTTGPINPGDLPGSKPPVLTPNLPQTHTGGTLPSTGNPNRNPIPPATNPGNYPGGRIPPILSGTPVPMPAPSGASPSPNPGYGTGYARRYGQFRVYADVGVAGDSYAPCWWLRANYDRTGNVYWLNRYKVCLW